MLSFLNSHPLFSNMPRWVRWLSISLFILAALALLSQLVVYAHYAASLLRFPFDYDQGEGFELHDTMLHSQGQWPYRDSQVFPFYTSIYPPLYHLMVVPLVWLFGPHLWTGRLVGIIASLVAASAIGWGVHRAANNRLIAAFSGLTFLASNYTFHVGPLFRQHMTMVMFETLAVVALAQAQVGKDKPLKHRWFYAGLVFLLAAGFTKQLALATVIAVFLFLLVCEPRRALLSGLGFAVVAAGLFLWINHATGYSTTVPPLDIFPGPLAPLNKITTGWWFISIIRANVNEFFIEQAVEFYRQWGKLHLIIIVIATARLIYEVYRKRSSIYAFWFVLAVANGMLAGKFGAGESYFITATAAACILSGIAVAQVWQYASRREQGWAVAAGALIPLLYIAQTRLTLHMYTEGPYALPARLLGVQSESGYYDSQGYTQIGPRPKWADHEAGWEIVELARDADEPVFSEEAAFLICAGKPVVTNAFPQLVMYQAGLFDPAEEIRMLDEQAFGLVILRAQFYPQPVLGALGSNYQLKTTIIMNGFIYQVLEPRTEDGDQGLGD
ncbi:MAG: hypothetical protein JXB30_17140 [Anaerolineae bacterium]|nr:hypothetical protein [Anaerolineae bacterium]